MGGFTLMEILVVIGIISMLMALLVVFGRRAITSAMEKKTHALVVMLSEACQTYRTDLGVFPDGSTSSDLYERLGKKRQKIVSRSATGNIMVEAEPYFIFKPDMLNSSTGAPTIIDAWSKEIQYASPGQHNMSGVDIWSFGNDGETDTEDDITNWKNPSD